MPPASKKQKRAEPPPPGSAAGAAAGGRQEPGMAPPPQSAARGLQTGVVKEFLQSIQRRDRLGPDFFNDAEKQQWDEWLDSVPADAAHSTDAQKLLPVQMPPKCLPRNTAGRSSDAATSMSQQQHLQSLMKNLEFQKSSGTGRKRCGYHVRGWGSAVQAKVWTFSK